MSQPPKVISTTKRKASTSEPNIQELFARIAQYNEEVESLKEKKKKQLEAPKMKKRR